MRGVSAQGAVQAGPGSATAPFVLAATTVRRGDVIVADDDGVLRVPLLHRSHTLGHRRRDHGTGKADPPCLTTQYRTA
ncbi:hypothetical protein [Streptomyces caniscabiei]|uniref:hypothetical protein n=1 Tax=Streptomyces caniscabiei TaxID=2746961 RepID=UPI000765EC27|nr:hypothetical protein [Streptomyces caniscabiei]